ncbi:hypothetical protein BED47_00770 [Gottfriedia luciferensis]|uniref:Uncharacterized protein n=1 Tax=Gottfriedia luciferensis TaxID=178774 RepID=A0ABX2ZVH0_9BACI|nr:hypothetical protein [Gottfriedia luciferensis]ODG93735.1 hypothetical protein BED47_00770 [Gottfriedia luciferensis]
MFNHKLFLKNLLSELTLNGQSVPYSYGLYNGQNNNYIVGIVYNNRGSQYIDDQESVTRYSIQLDIYTKVDNTSLVEDITNRMLNAGCTRLYNTESVFDDGTLISNLFFNYERSQ